MCSRPHMKCLIHHWFNAHLEQKYMLVFEKFKPIYLKKRCYLRFCYGNTVQRNNKLKKRYFMKHLFLN